MTSENQKLASGECKLLASGLVKTSTMRFAVLQVQVRVIAFTILHPTDEQVQTSSR
jgi:hypothetical protein